MLLTELLKKMQFRHNESQLQELDDESVDDDVCKLISNNLRVLQESLIKLQQVDHRLIQQQSLEERTGFRIFLCLNDNKFYYYNYDTRDACSES